jgi:very-short-patch-repair endonuclease
MANEIARDLRKRMTRQEVKLWVHLRSWRSRGFHFRRQAPRDRFVVDFICIKHRLVIEIDGGQHNFDAHARRDAQRDNHFAQQGYRVLRFWNNDVDKNLEGVLTLIDETLRHPPPDRPSADHPPPEGEGWEQAARQERTLDTLD